MLPALIPLIAGSIGLIETIVSKGKKKSNYEVKEVGTMPQFEQTTFTPTSTEQKKVSTLVIVAIAIGSITGLFLLILLINLLVSKKKK